MDKGIIDLPEEIESYRNKMSSYYFDKTIPRNIVYKWNSIIEPANLYSLGEDGVDRYLKGRNNLSEKNLICFALQAEILGHIEMANGFWKRAYLKSKSPHETASPKRNKSKPEEGQKYKEQENSKHVTSFQELWFTLIKEQKKYSCYSIFLVLPSDKEAKRYLTEYSDDLKIISKPSTLVMKTGSDQYLYADVDGKSLSVEISNDYGRIAHLFGIDFAKFPCMVVFEDMNSPKRLPVFLNGMKSEEIFEKMKVIFSIIQKSAREKKSPIEALQKHKNDEKLKHAGKAVIGTVRDLVGYTYTTIIQELTKIYAQKIINQ